MSLLPLNAKVKDQKFAELYDKQSHFDYSDIAPDPLTCHVSLLPHIALIKGANINNMLENEARQYLSTFTKKTIGTAGAVEDAINVCFDNAELIEWFDDENLQKGMFKVSVDLKDDLDLVYDERLFSLSTRLINNSKNVRSKLDAFDLKIKAHGNIGLNKSVITDIKLNNNIDFKTIVKNHNISSSSVSTINLSKKVDGYTAHLHIQNNYASTLNIELSNSSDFEYESTCKFDMKNGGVMNVKLQNNPNYESEVDVNMNITGGVVWAF